MATQARKARRCNIYLQSETINHSLTHPLLGDAIASKKEGERKPTNIKNTTHSWSKNKKIKKTDQKAKQPPTNHQPIHPAKRQITPTGLCPMQCPMSTLTDIEFKLPLHSCSTLPNFSRLLDFFHTADISGPSEKVRWVVCSWIDLPDCNRWD